MKSRAKPDPYYPVVYPDFKNAFERLKYHKNYPKFAFQSHELRSFCGTNLVQSNQPFGMTNFG